MSASDPWLTFGRSAFRQPASEAIKKKAPGRFSFAIAQAMVIRMGGLNYVVFLWHFRSTLFAR